MAGTGPAKPNFGNLDADQEQREKERIAAEQAKERNINQGLKAEEEHLEEDRSTTARNVQQDLNQGMDTGTHDSTRHGVDWGPAYERKVKPKKTSD